MADNIPVEGNLDLKGNQVKNGGFEVVTTLPTANNNFVGRQVTYEGRSYIWDGSAWKCDSDYLEIGGRNLLLGSEKEKRVNSTILNTPFDYSRMVGEGFFTISLEAKINSGDSGKFDFYFRSTSVGNVSPTKIANQDWERFSHTWELTRTQIETILTITVRTSAYQSDILIRNIKIEKGNIATDWTPAPEDKADENQAINFDTNNIEPTQSGTVIKTSTWLWQYLTQSVNFLWLKLKGLFPTTQATTHNYLPKIDNALKKLVKSNINDDGSRVQIDSPLRVNSKTFYNVAQRISTVNNETGSIYIEMPFGWKENIATYEIDIYNYTNNTKAKIIVSGYSYNGGLWYGTSVQMLGNLPSNIVRLGYNSVTNKCCILIGVTTTQWRHPQIYVSKVTQGFYNLNDWSVGWSISIITDESNITGIVTPQVNAGFDVDLLDGYHAGNNNGEIPINNGTLNTNLFAEKSNKVANRITITDFTTFNPTTLGLEIGESCNFTSLSAIGRPTFEVTTICTGIIQRVYGNHYMVIAYSGANKLYPYDLQFALGGYVGNAFQGWQLYNSQGILDLLKTVDGHGSGLDADLLDGKHASFFAGANHNHDYNLLANLPDIYNANHPEVETNDFDTLYDEEANNVWLCKDNMRNGPLDDNGGTDTSYNNFEHCVVQQFGDRHAGTKVQVLYITTGNVANLSNGFGSIFYRIQGDKWKRIVTYSDIADLQTQIDSLDSTVNNLTTTVDNKQDKLSILTDINIPSDGIATINPIGNKVYNVNLSGTTSWHTINLCYLNSLDEVSIIINNPNNAGWIAINQDALYKFVGVFPDFSTNSWIITIWKGLIFTNIIGG